MRILVLGNGGREHAIGVFLKQDPRVASLHFAPGNPGTATLGENLPHAATDLDAIAAWAARHRPDLVVIGPEAPLCLGAADRFRAMDIPAFGPGADGARLEGSKIFMKDILREAGIATAASDRFTSADAALAHVRNMSYPLVVKADGLAAGKGVIIADSVSDAETAIHAIMVDRQFGAAGDAVLMEEFLDGQEASIHAVTDGTTHVLLSSSQDHKRIGEGDAGPNTGGMGAYAPPPAVPAEMIEQINRTVFQPLIATLRRRGIDYRGVLYGGLMLTADGPKVLEFNCRFGDPETQVLLPMLETPLLDLLLAAVEGRLAGLELKLRDGAAMTVVLAAPGYPDQPVTGQIIHGLEHPAPRGTFLFHAGTRQDPGGAIRTSGGRVLSATGTGATLQEARDRAYALADTITFDGKQLRRDIGHRALTSTS